MADITITVDGREIEATAGQMLVDAAKHGDVEIPVFCYEPKLGPPVGACRMCLVEIEGIPKLQTACSTPVRDGMVVHTRNEQVTEAQNAVVEFLLVNHPLDCPVCDKGGECPLQDITMGWGPGRSRFTDPKRHFEKPLPLSPLVAIDRERCILCYRCVRFSQEISEDEQLHLLERGDRSYVGTFDDRPYIAPFHGNITELCPVGALTSYTYRFRARPWDVEEGGSICTLCPSQCNVKYTVRDEKVMRVLARDHEEVDDGWLCDRGRYGFEMWGSEGRLTTPMIREGGSLRQAGWGEALERAVAGLRGTGAATGAVVGDASNEEGYLLQTLIRQTLGSADIDSRLSGGASREQLLALADPAITARTRDLDRAGAILVLGTDPLESSPILDLRIRKAVRRAGSRLLVATDRPTALDGGSLAGARYAPGQAGPWISALAESLGAAGGRSAADHEESGAATEISDGAGASSSAGFEDSSTAVAGGGPAWPDGVADVAEALKQTDSVVVVWGERLAREPGAVDAVLELADALGFRAANAPETTPEESAGKASSGQDAEGAGAADGSEEAAGRGGGLLGIPDIANGRGLAEVGALPDAGPGLGEPQISSGGSGGAATAGERGRSAEGMREALTAGELRGLIAFGSDPAREAPGSSAWRAAFSAADFTVAFSMFADETTAAADVVFPLESPAEKEGTVTHPDGRLQRVRPNAVRPGDVRPAWQVLAELNAMLGNETGISSAPDALAALAGAVPFYAGITPEEIGGRGVRWQDRPQAQSPESALGAGAAGGAARPAREAPESQRPAGREPLPGGPDVPGAERAPGAGLGMLSGSSASADVHPASRPVDGEIRLATYRGLWAGPVTEQAPALEFLKPAQRVELAPADAERLGLEHGDHVEVSRNGSSVMARALIRERMLPGAAFMLEGTAENNANELTGSMTIGDGVAHPAGGGASGPTPEQEPVPAEATSAAVPVAARIEKVEPPPVAAAEPSGPSATRAPGDPAPGLEVRKVAAK